MDVTRAVFAGMDAFFMKASSSKMLLVAVLALMCLSAPALAQSLPKIDNPLNIPDMRQMLPVAADRQAISSSLQILVLLTVLSLAPAIFILTTSFTSSCWPFFAKPLVPSSSRPVRCWWAWR
jgi:flagellar biosynthesis protein FliP